MRKTLRACLSLFHIRIAEGLQYRVAALSGAVVSIVYALIEITVFTVFFTHGNISGNVFNGLDLPRVVSYAWLVQILAVMSFQTIDGEIMAKITNGDVGIEICRPLDLYWHWFSKTAAGKFSTLVMRGGVTMIAGAVLSFIGFSEIGLGFPSSLSGFALFFLSVCSAYLFSTAYGMFMTAVRLNVTWGDGLMNIINVSGMILSGGFLPLQLWPDFMQRFLLLQPFASSLDIPARLYVGSIEVGDAVSIIFLQVIWITIFILAGRLVMRQRLKTIIIQGG